MTATPAEREQACQKRARFPGIALGGKGARLYFIFIFFFSPVVPYYSSDFAAAEHVRETH